MKLIALGDTHGRTDWKEIVAEAEFDKVIFIGDYCDTRQSITPEQQKSNFVHRRGQNVYYGTVLAM